MNAIYGIVTSHDDPGTTEWFESMDRSLDHYSVNKSGKYKGEGLHFGCNQKFLDARESHVPQPLEYEHWVIIADAFICNRAELMNTLSLSEASASGYISDAFIILKAYEKWGKNCPKHLIGSFAFAIWDKKSRSLFMVRDHMAGRCLFYTFHQGHFLFASEIRALARIKKHELEIDGQEMALQLSALSVPPTPDGSIYKGIQSMRPRHTLTLKDGNVQIEPYWQIDWNSPIRFKNKNEYPEALLALITQCVEERCRTDLPIGILFSGGLDSSGIAVILARHLAKKGKQLFAVSSIPANGILEGRDDDREYIEAFLRQEENVVHSYSHIPPSNQLFPELEEWLDMTFQPGPHYYRTGMRLYAALRENNVGVMFDGAPGDATVSSTFRHPVAYLLKQKRWKAAFELFNQTKRAEKSPLHQNIIRQVIKPLAPGLFHLYHSLRRSSIPEKKLANLQLLSTKLQGEFSDIIGHGIEKFQHSESPYSPIRLLESPLARAFTNYAPGLTHNGIFHHLPFVDIRLIEFIVNIPPEMLPFDGVWRGLYRKAFEHLLPQKILHRKTKGVYEPSFIDNLKSSVPDALGMIQERKNHSLINEMIHIENLKRAVEQFGKEEQPLLYPAKPLQMATGLELMKFLLWFEKFKNS